MEEKIESFTEAMNRAENLEKTEGQITDEVLAIRKWAKQNYPAEFTEYLKNKTNKPAGAGETIRSNVFGKIRIDDKKSRLK